MRALPGVPASARHRPWARPNLAAGLRDAYMGHSPVIALTGGRWGHQKHKINYQEMDDFPMFSQVTKANFQADTVGRIPDLLRQAFREATSGTPAPVNVLFAGKEGDIEHEEADLKLIAEEAFHAGSRLPPRAGNGQREGSRATAEKGAAPRDRRWAAARACPEQAQKF